MNITTDQPTHLSQLTNNQLQHLIEQVEAEQTRRLIDQEAAIDAVLETMT